jgi:hypothetical protein
MTREEFEAAWREMPRDERMLLAETVIEELCSEWGLDKPDIAFVYIGKDSNGHEVYGDYSGPYDDPNEPYMIRIDVDEKVGSFAQIDNPWFFLDTTFHEFGHYAQDTLGETARWDASNHYISDGPRSVEMFGMVQTHVFLGQILWNERFTWIDPPTDPEKIQPPGGYAGDARTPIESGDYTPPIDFKGSNPGVELDFENQQNQLDRGQRDRALDFKNTDPQIELEIHKPKSGETPFDPNWPVLRDGGN